MFNNASMRHLPKRLSVPLSALCATLAVVLLSGVALASERLAWFDGTRPNVSAQQAVEILAAAGSHGMQPEDYNATALAQAMQRASQAPLDAAEIDRLEQTLTVAMERYLADVHDGRIAARHLEHGYAAAKRNPFDAAAYLQEALAGGRLRAAASEAAPRLSQYEQLRAALSLTAR